MESYFPLRRVVTKQDVILSDKERIQLATRLQQPPQPADVYTAYRFATSQQDAVNRFMFLYNILLRLHRDNQTLVDNFIRQEDPNVAETPSPLPRKRNMMETVYTKLRNEVAHARQGSTPNQTRDDIASHVDGLQAIVRSALI